MIYLSGFNGRSFRTKSLSIVTWRHLMDYLMIFNGLILKVLKHHENFISELFLDRNWDLPGIAWLDCPGQVQKVYQSKTPDPLGSNFDDGILPLANFALFGSKIFKIFDLKFFQNFIWPESFITRPIMIWGNNFIK